MHKPVASLQSLPPRQCLRTIDVLVLAGGLGTRIRPVLGDMPKLLAPVGGRPFLSYLLRWLVSFGARRVVFALGHAAAAVQRYLREFRDPALEVVAVVEPRPLGTAGAVRFARAQLRTDPVLVMNGDSFVDADLCNFLTFHRAAGAIGTVLCANVANADRFGRVTVGEDARIREFVEKDPAFGGPAVVNCGAYLLSSALLDAIMAVPGPSLERDVFELLPPGSLAALIGPFSFIDIGTPEALAAAAAVLAPLFGPLAEAQTQRGP
jgi:NDP-sugar pyrophosphorylase family protein